MKTLVTHISPDLDAITAIWLIKKYLKGWSNADVKFVIAGESLENKPPDKNPNIIHVDTGMGIFDHHQEKNYTSASKKVLNFLISKRAIRIKDIPALERIVDIVTAIDHFTEVYFPDPDSDLYLFFAPDIIQGYKSFSFSDNNVILFGETILNSIFQMMKQKICAEEDLKKGFVFKSKWGKSIACKTENNQVLYLALKKKFSFVIVKNPKKGFVKISINPKSKKNLKKLYNTLIKKDPNASWFYHSSGKIIINGPAYNPKRKPTKLTLEECLKIIKEEK